MSMAVESQKPERLVSLDTYRGFLMLVLATSAFQIHKLAAGVRQGPLWDFLSYQFSHPEWRSCSFWDLVQPSFMFMVGVAVPYSVASRRAKGDAKTRVAPFAPAGAGFGEGAAAGALVAGGGAGGWVAPFSRIEAPASP